MNANRPRRLSRRDLLTTVVTAAGAVGLAACTPTPPPAARGPAATAAAPPTAPPQAAQPTAPAAQAAKPTAPAATAVPTAQAAPTTQASAKPAAASRGALTAAIGINFPASLDPAKDTKSTYVGIGETLTWTTPSLAIEPWLAQQITNVDPTTWRVTLRPNAKFWDGSPVDAEAVIASFKRSFETQPAAALYLPKEMTITAQDARTLLFKTPQPSGEFPSSLAAPYFVVHKPGSANDWLMTGPYRPTRFEADQQLELAGFAEHWAGPPPLERLTVKLLQDGNARVLALQSGDVDLVHGVPNESAKALGPEIDVQVVPSTRVHFMLLNHQKPPFNDLAVRQATSQAIDRQALNDAPVQGLGKPIVGVFPPGYGMDTPASTKADVDKARRLLDEAGWRPGPDGIRAKDGNRLAFTLYSAPGRAELTPMAVLISGQLKDLGYELQVQESRTLSTLYKDGNFEAAMSSSNSLGTGDPQRIFVHALMAGGVDNVGKYKNDRLDEAVARLRVEFDLEKRKAIGREAQEIVLADMANVYLVAAPYVVAHRKERVAQFKAHPSDTYFVDPTLTAR